MEAFFTSIQMPISLHELGLEVSDEDIRELAHKCSFFGKRTIGCVKKLDEKDMRNIYKNAK